MLLNDLTAGGLAEVTCHPIQDTPDTEHPGPQTETKKCWYTSYQLKKHYFGVKQLGGCYK